MKMEIEQVGCDKMGRRGDEKKGRKEQLTCK